MVLVRGLFLTEDRISLLLVLRLFFFFLDPVSAEWALLITLLVALVATVPMAALARGMKKDMACIQEAEILSSHRCAVQIRSLCMGECWDLRHNKMIHSVITGLLVLATAVSSEKTTLDSLVFRNDNRTINDFLQHAMTLVNSTEEATMNATLRHALAVPWDRNDSRCALLHVPKGCSGARNDSRELHHMVTMQRAVCASGVSGESNYTVELGFTDCFALYPQNTTCASHAIACLQNLTARHDPTQGLVEKWVRSADRTRAIRDSAIAVLCVAIVTTLIMAVFAVPIGGAAAGEVAGTGLIRELPWVFGRFSKAQAPSRVLEVQFLGLDER